MTASTSTPRPIRLLIVEDSELVRMGLRAVLASEKAIRVVGEAGNVTQALAAGDAERPDVVLMDIRLPDGTGFEVCRQLRERLPATRVIFLTSVVDNKLVDEAIRSGGSGYLLKEIDGTGLIRAIHDVAAGKSILDPMVTERVMKMAHFGPNGHSLLGALSPQETKVLESVAVGKTNKEVGLDLGLTEKTVKNYLASVFSKLSVSSRTQAAILYKNELAENKTN